MLFVTFDHHDAANEVSQPLLGCSLHAVLLQQIVCSTRYKLQHRAIELKFVAEIVIDSRDIHLRPIGNLANSSCFVTDFGEDLAGGFNELAPRLFVLCCRCIGFTIH